MSEPKPTEPIQSILLAIVRAGYDPGTGQTDGEQIWNGQWWRPRWGCDTLEKVMEEVEALLRDATP